MASLINTKIKDTYESILKTLDNAAIGVTEKNITDGAGNASTFSIGTSSASFTGTLDLSGATVTGLPASGNLINGVGADSLKNADSLVTSAAIADGPQALALGNGATANGLQSIALGNGAQSTNNQGIAIGNFAESTSVGTAAVGEYASASGLYATAWGRTANAASDGAVAFGQQTNVPFSAPGGVAIGRQVQADLSDTTHVRALKIVAPDGGTGGNGITMLSPDGTAGVITLTNASELAVDGTPIGGGGGAAGLVTGGATGSQKSADALSDGNNSASGYRSIALGSGNQANSNIGVAIGNYTRTGASSVAIGDNANTSYGAKSRSVSIGRTANAEDNAVAIGNQATASADSAVALGNGVTAATANTATVNLLQIAGYASMNFADDTAAATGGIPLGGVYHTDGALKIRIA